MAANLAHLLSTGSYTILKPLNATELTLEKDYSPFYNLYNISQWSGRAAATKEGLLYQFIVGGCGIVVLTVFSLLGNVVTITVLHRNRMYSRSINNLLVALAMSDTVFTLATMFLIAVPVLCTQSGLDFSQFYSFMSVPFVWPLVLTAYTCTTWLTVAITLERYLVVAHPIYARVICTSKRSLYVAGAVLGFAVLFNLPRWWEFQYVGVVTPEDAFGEEGEEAAAAARIMYMPLSTDIRRNYYFDRFYSRFSFFMVIYIIPIIILIVFNSLIYRVVKEARSTRTKDLGSARHNTTTAAVNGIAGAGASSLGAAGDTETAALARMLFSIVIIYLSCNSIGILEMILVMKTGDPSGPVIEATRNFLLTFNSSVNFIIYCWYGEQFRAIALKMLRCCGKSKGASTGVGANMSGSRSTIKMSV